MKRGLRWARPTPTPGSGAAPAEVRAEHPTDERAYSTPESLFMDQYERLARAIALIARDREVARDAVQEAFARLCRDWPTVSGYQNQVAWVRKVALNQVRDQQRRRARRGHLSLSLEQTQEDPRGLTDLGASQTSELPADADLSLWQAVRRLPERQRTAVGLFYIADLTVSQVAATMGVSEGTVKRRLDRARNTLRGEDGGLDMVGRIREDSLKDEELRTELNRLVPEMPPEHEWAHVQERLHRTIGRTSVGTAQPWKRAPLAGLTAQRRRRRGVFAYTAISCAVLVVLAGLGTGIFEAVRHLSNDQPILLITDDTLTPDAIGQTIPSTAVTPRTSEGTWQRLPLSVEGGAVSALVMDPADPTVLYATTDQGWFKTSDGATTWTSVPAEESVLVMTVDPNSPSTWYRISSSDGTLYKSVDSGTTWARTNAPSDDALGPFGRVSVDASTSPSTLYAAFTGSWDQTRLFKSTDGGSTWTEVTPVGYPMFAGRLTTDPSHHTLYFTGSSSGPLRSSDGGATWKRLRPGLPPGWDATQPLILVDPRDPSRLYLCDAFGWSAASDPYVSLDAGESWTALDGAERDWARAVSLAAAGTPVDAIDAAEPFLAAFTGTVTDSAGGQKVGAVGSDPGGDVGVLIDPQDPAVLYLPTTRGVYKSIDGGATWRQASSGMTDTSVGMVAVDPVSPSTLYATTSIGIMKSSDDGATWTDILDVDGDTQPGNPVPTTSVVVAPSSPSTLYALTPRGLRRSDDGGATWTAPTAWGLETGLGRLLLVASYTPNTVYASGEVGLYRSTDGGTTWSQADLPEGFEVAALVEAPGDPLTLYAAGRDASYRDSVGYPAFNGLFRSTDGGQTWTQLGDTSAGPVPVAAASVAVSTALLPGGLDTIWVSTLNPGAPWAVMRSTDGGTTWNEVEIEKRGDDLPRTVVADPQNAGMICVVLGGRDPVAVYRSTDDGTTWKNIRAGLPEDEEWQSAEWRPRVSVVPGFTLGGTLYMATLHGLFKWTPEEE